MRYFTRTEKLIKLNCTLFFFQLVISIGNHDQQSSPIHLVPSTRKQRIVLKDKTYHLLEQKKTLYQEVEINYVFIVVSVTSVQNILPENSSQGRICD